MSIAIRQPVDFRVEMAAIYRFSFVKILFTFCNNYVPESRVFSAEKLSSIFLYLMYITHNNFSWQKYCVTDVCGIVNLIYTHNYYETIL